jgi:hypothetical protein
MQFIMKHGFLNFRSSLLGVCLLLVSVGLLSSCKKNLENNSNIPVAALMAFNLTPDNAALGLALSGNLLTNNALGYTNYTGGYLNIYPGERAVQAFDQVKDSTLVTSGFNFEANKYYSLFVVGNKGNYKNLVVHDSIDSLASSTGKAYVRYVNAVPDSSVMNVSIDGSVDNPASKFATVSDFTAVNPGDVKISITGNNEISANRTISFESGKIYTVLLVGDPAATDNAKTVQIKYILNGNL